jgi:hypothetical protein
MTPRFIRTADLLTTTIEDTLIMLNVPRGSYHSLNDVGARIWALLEQPVSEPEIVEQLVQEFEVDPDACAIEVATFLGKLRERGLAAESPAS